MNDKVKFDQLFTPPYRTASTQTITKEQPFSSTSERRGGSWL